MAVKCLLLTVSWLFATCIMIGLMVMDILGLSETSDFGRACLYLSVALYGLITICFSCWCLCCRRRNKSNDSTTEDDVNSVDSESVADEQDVRVVVE